MTDWADKEAERVVRAYYSIKHARDDLADALRAERERCAKIADGWTPEDPDAPCYISEKITAEAIATAIRAND